jgi:hypothetical protein
MDSGALELITDKYRAMNAKLHQKEHAYGCSGAKWADLVLDVVDEFDAADVLDYGCGKQTLAGMIGHLVKCRGFDPAIKHLSAPPEPADVVTCTDVMEHVEPEFTDQVIADVMRLAKKAAVFVISCERGGRKLPDGRYAHLVVKPPAWWRAKLEKYGSITEHPQRSKTTEFVCVIRV